MYLIFFRVLDSMDSSTLYHLYLWTSQLILHKGINFYQDSSRNILVRTSLSDPHVDTKCEPCLSVCMFMSYSKFTILQEFLVSSMNSNLQWHKPWTVYLFNGDSKYGDHSVLLSYSSMVHQYELLYFNKVDESILPIMYSVLTSISPCRCCHCPQVAST